MPIAAAQETAPGAITTAPGQQNDHVEYRPWREGYRVGSDGTVWTCWRRANGDYELTTEWRQVQQHRTSAGYMAVSLRSKSHHVHSLVLEAFVGPRPEGHQCRHLDGVRDNNVPGNLAWGTPAENTADKVRHGTVVFGEQIASAKLTDADVVAIRKAFADGKDTKSIADEYGISDAATCAAIYGRTWRHVEGRAQETVEIAHCARCRKPFHPRIKQGPNKSRFCCDTCRNRYHSEKRMNPLETAQPFSLTLANPNPKFRTRKDGDRWFIEFEVSADEAAYFTDPNINRKGMVIEAIHCEVTNLNMPEKPKAEDKPKGGPLSHLAALWCRDPQFWEWLNEQNAKCGEPPSTFNEQDARRSILEHCDIKSRAELDHDGRAKRIFEEHFRRPYANYLARLGR